jgi:tape measure domain-containing protein
MAIKAAQLMVEIGADVTGLQKGLRTADSGLNNFAKNVGRFGGILSATLTAPVALAAREIFNLGARMEQSTVAFTTMLGSSEKAARFLKDLRDFAAQTPFEFTELQDASRKMLAFGFAAKEIIPTLTAVGNAAAGLGIGSDGIQRIILALGQMQAKAKVSAQEMMQLTEAGIPAWKYLAEAMGKSTSEVMKLSEKGLIPAGKAIQMILSGMEKDFGSMMAEQSKTALGQISNLKDELEVLATDISELILPTVKDLISMAREMVKTLSSMPDSTKKTIIELSALAAAAGPVLIGLSGIATAIGKIAAIGAGAAAVISGIATGIRAFASGLSLTTSLGAAGLTPLAITLGSIAAVVGSIVGVWAQWNKQIVQTNKAGVQGVKSAWSDFFQRQIEEGKNATQILNEYRLAQERIKEILKIDFAKGGIAEVAKLFVDKNALMRASADELANALLRASTSYREYVMVLQSAGLTDHLISEAEYLAATRGEVDATASAMDNAGMAAEGFSAKLTGIEEAASAQVKKLKSLIDEYDNLRKKMDDWVQNTASQVHDALGRRFSESSKAFRDALAIVDEVLGTNYVQQLKLSDSVKSLVDQYARTKDLDAFREGLIKIKDEGLANLQKQLQDVVEKAQSLYDKLLSLPKDIRIKIGFDIEDLPAWLLAAGTRTTKPSSKAPRPEASGGPVFAGELYLVGERGHELFVPSVPGRIIPNDQLTSNKLIIENVNIVFRDTSFSPEELSRAIRQLEWMYT